MNTVNVSGKILNLTIKVNSNGTKMAIGTVGIYRQKDPQLGKAKYDNVQIIGYGKIADFMNEGDSVALTGNLNTYQKDVGLEYPITITQINVTHVDNFTPQSKPVIKEHPSTGLDMGSIDEAVDQITIKDSDLPF
ncbi:hypothetical protein [Lactiplantibacillus pentosus]|uniref:Single-stranded DNA-binding protein n=1 Tax=Lactiplantibacillus pentosus TaxID=1589 RepID=A0AB37RLX6_LACPE|nr:hypothetical protein [Lactiplantibacillus pentosus]RMW49944.1 hypothetical protein D6U20_00210 [Lactiplantibacillus pentosus]RMW50475.1 hypothetical protein D6U19_00060 [Lactiplantibacillus pentosus]RMW57302.1 hypothetical protein D6U17_00780 [Lactiplantibacillus pentosus]RMW57668.1 hypothetical protein D6U21_00685 [Lactiplantibacillus pentosus]